MGPYRGTAIYRCTSRVALAHAGLCGVAGRLARGGGSDDTALPGSARLADGAPANRASPQGLCARQRFGRHNENPGYATSLRRAMGSLRVRNRSEENTSELHALISISYAVFCL